MRATTLLVLSFSLSVCSFLLQQSCEPGCFEINRGKFTAMQICGDSFNVCPGIKDDLVDLCSILSNIKNASCPENSYITGFDDDWNPICTFVTSNSNFSCPLGEYVTGFDSDGVPTCSNDSLSDSISNLDMLFQNLTDFSCESGESITFDDNGALSCSDESLVSYYPFTAGSLSDFGKRRVDLSNYGGVPALDRFGDADNAYEFTPAGLTSPEYLVSTANGLPTGPRTTAMWIYPTTLGGTQSFFGYGGDGAACPTADGGWYFIFNIPADNLRLEGNCGSFVTLAPITTADLVNTWTHVAGTTDGTFVRIYLDGVMVAETVSGFETTKVENKDFTIGYLPGTDGIAPTTGLSPFEGSIDDVRIYNRVLSDQEIMDLANDI